MSLVLRPLQKASSINFMRCNQTIQREIGSMFNIWHPCSKSSSTNNSYRRNNKKCFCGDKSRFLSHPGNRKHANRYHCCYIYEAIVERVEISPAPPSIPLSVCYVPHPGGRWHFKAPCECPFMGTAINWMLFLAQWNVIVVAGEE